MTTQYATRQQTARMQSFPMKTRTVRSLVNRWGSRLSIGQAVSVVHPRGGCNLETIASFETSGNFVRAYGKRVRLTSGLSASIDDCIPIAN